MKYDQVFSDFRELLFGLKADEQSMK